MGCRACIAACPYGARYRATGIKEYFPRQGLTAFEQLGLQWHATSGVVEKCDFCLSTGRLEQGREPACVEVCMTRAVVFRRVMGGVNSVFALMTIIYTGLLLGSLRPIPLWRSPLIPTIFLVSGLSTGLMATVMGVIILEPIHPVVTNPETTLVSAMFEGVLLVLEGLLVAFYLEGSHLLEASRAMVRKIVRGDLAAPFWVGFAVLGFLIPLGVNMIGQLQGPARLTHSLGVTLLGTVSGLMGGYFLRFVIVAAGIKAPLSVQAVIVPPIPEI